MLTRFALGVVLLLSVCRRGESRFIVEKVRRRERQQSMTLARRKRSCVLHVILTGSRASHQALQVKSSTAAPKAA